MTVLSQSSKETSCCSPLLMENRNEYLTGNEDKWRFCIREGCLGESHPHGCDPPPCPAVLLSWCVAVGRGDTTKSEQPYMPEKAGVFFHSSASTQMQWHLVLCTPKCRIADQQGSSSPLHRAINSGTTVVGREDVWEKVGLAEEKLGSGSRVVSAFTLDILIEEIPDSIHWHILKREGFSEWKIFEKKQFDFLEDKKESKIDHLINWSIHLSVCLSIHLSVYCEITTYNLLFWNTKWYQKSYGTHTMEFIFWNRCMPHLLLLSIMFIQNFNSCILVNGSRAGLASLHLTHIPRQPKGIQTLHIMYVKVILVR